MKVKLPLCDDMADNLWGDKEFKVYYVPVQIWNEEHQVWTYHDEEFLASGEETDKRFGLNSSEFSLANGGMWCVDLGAEPLKSGIKEMYFTNRKNALKLRTYLARELRNQGYKVEYEDFA